MQVALCFHQPKNTLLQFSLFSKLPKKFLMAYLAPSQSLFISYRSIEKDLPLKLAADIMKQGYPVWMDRLQGVLPGDPWRKSLEEGVNHAAGVVAFLSRNYAESTWCRRELQRADSLKKPIFPILIGPVSDELWPMEIQDRQYGDFQNWEDQKAYQSAFELLLDGLKKNLLPGPALVPPPPGHADPGRDDPEDEIERGIAKTKELGQADPFAAFEAEELRKDMEMVEKQYKSAAQSYRMILDDALRVRLELQKTHYKAEWEKLKGRLDAMQV